jgi:putative (di)nucleoside polyphosphate hydrolase
MNPDDAARLPYRPCVVALLFNRDGKVLVGRRADAPGEAWQLPQGGIRDGETPGEAVKRELAEEVGTDRAEIVAEGRHWHVYDLPRHLVGRKWKGRYRGQRLKCFALRFTGEDGDLDVRASELPEFADWKWVEIEELPTLAVDFKRPVYEAIVAEFLSLVKTARRE